MHEEALDLIGAKLARMTQSVKPHKATDPLDVGLLRPGRTLHQSQNLPHPLHEFRFRLHGSSVSSAPLLRGTGNTRWKTRKCGTTDQPDPAIDSHELDRSKRMLFDQGGR
jgi:hypothetical protein